LSYVLDLKNKIKRKNGKTKNENQRNVLFPLDNRHFITVLLLEQPVTFNINKAITIIVVILRILSSPSFLFSLLI